MKPRTLETARAVFFGVFISSVTGSLHIKVEPSAETKKGQEVLLVCYERHDDRSATSKTDGGSKTSCSLQWARMSKLDITRVGLGDDTDIQVLPPLVKSKPPSVTLLIRRMRENLTGTYVCYKTCDMGDFARLRLTMETDPLLPETWRTLTMGPRATPLWITPTSTTTSSPSFNNKELLTEYGGVIGLGITLGLLVVVLVFCLAAVFCGVKTRRRLRSVTTHDDQEQGLVNSEETPVPVFWDNPPCYEDVVGANDGYSQNFCVPRPTSNRHVTDNNISGSCPGETGNQVDHVTVPSNQTEMPSTSSDNSPAGTDTTDSGTGIFHTNMDPPGYWQVIKEWVAKGFLVSPNVVAAPQPPAYSEVAKPVPSVPKDMQGASDC